MSNSHLIMLDIKILASYDPDFKTACATENIELIQKVDDLEIVKVKIAR